VQLQTWTDNVVTNPAEMDLAKIPGMGLTQPELPTTVPWHNPCHLCDCTGIDTHCQRSCCSLCQRDHPQLFAA